MVKDKYNAVWVSHSSIGDFLKCPRLYYLHNVYKSPVTGRKMNIVSPALSLGSAVHEVIEGLASFKVEERPQKLSRESLLDGLEKAWKKVSGKKGGFISEKEEGESKEKAKMMLERVEKNPGHLLEKTIKIKEGNNGMSTNFYLSEEDNIILCGKIDWLVYKPESDSVHILDFKTGKNEEKEESLQLPIYQLLLKKMQKRKIDGASYWYLLYDDFPTVVSLSDEKDSFDKVYSIAKKIKKARDLGAIEGYENIFVCPNGKEGCFACRPFEKVKRGEGEFVGIGDMRQDIFIV